MSMMCQHRRKKLAISGQESSTTEQSQKKDGCYVVAVDAALAGQIEPPGTLCTAIMWNQTSWICITYN